MDEFDIERQPEPPADYVTWSLNNFKVEVEDVVEHPVLCNLEPWNADPCGIIPHSQENLEPEPIVKMEFQNSAPPPSGVLTNPAPRPDIVKMEFQKTAPTERLDAENILSEDQLSIVDLSHICEIVGTKEDADQPKQFLCLYCGLQLTWNSLCLHMKFGHNSHDKVKLCKRFDCEYHTKIQVEPEAETTASSVKLPEVKETNGVEQQIEMHKCSVCDFQTKKKSNLREHVKYTHAKEEEIELYKCLICGFQTKYKYGLKKHAKKHSELTLHKCSFCDYQTIMPLLLEHIKFKHNEEQAGALPQ